MNQNHTKIRKITVSAHNANMRLDVFLSESLSDLSRSYIKKLIEKGNILVNSHHQKPHYKIHPEDAISIIIPTPEALKIEPEDIPLDIIYEDSSIVVISKQPDIVVHPAPGNYHHTLVNAILFHIQFLGEIGGVIRPGIVHRLDKDTSGCLVIAKNDNAYQHLLNQFKNRQVKKEYLAIVGGKVILEQGIIEAPVGRHPAMRKKMMVKYSGREAVTEFYVQERFKESTLLKLSLKTGRTHQIRVHLAHIGHPVLGDSTYGRKYHELSKSLGIKRQLLHAWKLEFQHPERNEWLKFEAPVPEDMTEVIEKLTED